MSNGPNISVGMGGCASETGTTRMGGIPLGLIRKFSAESEGDIIWMAGSWIICFIFIHSLLADLFKKIVLNIEYMGFL